MLSRTLAAPCVDTTVLRAPRPTWRGPPRRHRGAPGAWPGAPQGAAHVVGADDADARGDERVRLQHGQQPRVLAPHIPAELLRGRARVAGGALRRRPAGRARRAPRAGRRVLPEAARRALKRTGSVLNSSRTATVVPGARAAAAVPASRPAWSYVRRAPAVPSAVRVTTLTSASAHSELSASPRKPNVASSCGVG